MRTEELQRPPKNMSRILILVLCSLYCCLADNVELVRSKRGTRFYGDCYSSKCYNGGTCKEAVYSSDYICQCPVGFSGSQCEINTKEKCVVGSGDAYRGTWSISKSGAECINWNATALRAKKFTARKVDASTLGLGNHNFCRNPDQDSGPWCYTYKGTQITWEFCSLPKCPEDKYEECARGLGLTYRGTKSVTKTGGRCLPWDSPAIVRKYNNAWRSDALEVGLGSHSYCRNPDGDAGPWCHTYKNMQLTWELCDVPKCTRRPSSITPVGPRGPTTNNNNNNRGACGQRLDNTLKQPTFRMFGGRESDITEQPWQAAINVYQARLRRHFHRCGGILIDSCWVLSAAHCFEATDKPSKLEVILGRTFRKENSTSEQIFKVEKYWIHEKFDNETFDNDIALLKLKTDIGVCAVNSPEVLPACLPEPSLVLPDWTECEISGYGKDSEFSAHYSERVKRGFVRLWPSERCVPDVLSGRTVTPNMLCAGDTRGLDDACKGDSGGPLVCRTNDKMTLMGVISWGDGCGQRDKPGVYTRVTHYINWINGKMRANPV
ncbi:tissue-type plasminogen activator isoform X3 [Syngnathoides biaculeatus]|uniref:tissue-type plasminogen activator isoform X3 n=1 Tax=Syngnathoides biaculeatus TaxID=300417 RepID=UPI002ADE0BA0|nr:tissue-type plasminogen activator isoform X3 [Syngnathoides biaculeatus]